MKNKEKNASKIVEIACKGHDFGVDKNTDEVADCCGTPCTTCLFLNMDDSYKARRQWAESEYIEKPVISKKDIKFLEYFREECVYIARDENEKLYVYNSKPVKEKNYWYLYNGCCSWLNFYSDVDLPMVKWSDEEPWLIEDLKKLDVVEEYE